VRGINKKRVEVKIFGEGLKEEKIGENFDVYLIPVAGYHGRLCNTGSDTSGVYPYWSLLL
jgi:hypothetical protein